jgi:hypothetical protein
MSYFGYYHRSRTHLALAKDAPDRRTVMPKGKITAIPQVGGLHHRYERRAAGRHGALMDTLNRSAIVVTPEQPFWTGSTPPIPPAMRLHRSTCVGSRRLDGRQEERDTLVRPARAHR